MAKKIELIPGVSISVPGNFPDVVVSSRTDGRTFSFNLKPHPEAKRFALFFEVTVCAKAKKIPQLLPEIDYSLGKSTDESFSVCGIAADMKIIDMELSHPCGSKVKSQLLAMEINCACKDRLVYLVSFTMVKSVFLKIAKTLKCR